MPEWIVPLLTILLGGGGLITAIAAWRKDAKKAPIEAQTAQVADALAVSHAAATWVETQEKRTAAQDIKIDKLVIEMGLLRDELFGWQFWYTGELVANWDNHRAKEDPPPPPKRHALKS